MRPMSWRDIPMSRSRRSRSGRGGGFTLVEMMVSVTLVLLMMLMFAEIYGLAQETISKQKGIATNDQKARILAEVLRTDLENRTFVNVYPFKCEGALNAGQPEFTIPDEYDHVLKERRGYFSYSENDPNNDGDDILQFTRSAEAGHRIYGTASDPGSDPVPGGPDDRADWPQFDDGRAEAVGASSMAEVSYFLRYGNLYRSVLLIREPYQVKDQPPPRDQWGNATPASFRANFPDYPNFWSEFDYSAYRDIDDDPVTPGNQTAVKFHGPQSLSNNPDTAITDPPPNLASLFRMPGHPPGAFLFLPRSLGAPQLRFGHSLALRGQPHEFNTPYDASTFTVDTFGGDDDGMIEASDWQGWHEATNNFGRFNAQERSSAQFEYPGTGFTPFAGGTPQTLVDGNENGLVDRYEGGPRRGVDLMMPNVHSFDVQVWDDVLGQFVSIGYGREDEDRTNPDEPWHVGTNPYTGAGPQFGFYHISRLRRTYTGAGGAFQVDFANIRSDSGNRYDTWSPSMFIASANKTGGTFPAGTTFTRNGRAPYRPLRTNPDPNTTTFNQPSGTPPLNYEQRIDFGEDTLDDDGDGTPFPSDVADDDAEARLRAIRIVVRYLDPHSGQTRQATIEQSLIE